MKIFFRRRNYFVHKFYLFIAIIALFKLYLMGAFSSDYQNSMFIPFVRKFLNGIGTSNWNVYSYYYKNNLLASFPYPPLMLIIESIGEFLNQLVSPNYLFIQNFIFKIPLFIFDLLGLFYLIKLYPSQRRYIAVLYYASPITIYATFMHGQLDIIPTTLLIGAIYYLINKKRTSNIKSALFLGLSMLTKLHILAAIPILILMIYKKDGIKKAMSYIAITLAVVGVGCTIFFSEGFIYTVLLNSEQSVLTNVFLNYNTVKLYIPIAAIFLVYLVAFNLNKINRDLLMSFCGIVFAIFLALCPPMPGWYVWIVPFVVLYFIRIDLNKYKNILIYALLNLLYVIYFIFFHKTKYVDLYFYGISLQKFKIVNEYISNITFTILSALLFYITIQMYQNGIASNSLYKRKNNSFTIGIAGDSGSGKSTFIKIIESCLGKENLLQIEGDGDHRWERGEKMWDKYTHLNPKANFLYRQARDMNKLKNGITTNRVEYDHKTGKFSKEHKIKAKDYILICGLHSLYLPQMRNCLDLKIYMDIDENLRRYWKIERDTAQRGYSKSEIVEQIETRMNDAKRYIYPQREFADFTVQYFDENLKNYFAEGYKVKVSFRLTFSAEIDIEPVIKELSYYDIDIQYDFSNDLKRQVLKFNAENFENKKIPFGEIVDRIVPQIEEITKQNLNNIANNTEGIIALFLLKLISNKMQGGN